MTQIPSEYSRLDESKLYLWRITGINISKAGQNSEFPGEPQIVVQLETRKPDEWEGKQLLEWLSMPVAILPTDAVGVRRRKVERGIRMRQFMDAFGVPYGPQGFKTEDWIGYEAGGTIANKADQNGDMRSRPKKYMPKSVVLEALEKAASMGDSALTELTGGPSIEGGDPHGI